MDFYASLCVHPFRIWCVSVSVLLLSPNFSINFIQVEDQQSTINQCAMLNLYKFRWIGFCCCFCQFKSEWKRRKQIQALKLFASNSQINSRRKKKMQTRKNITSKKKSVWIVVIAIKIGIFLLPNVRYSELYWLLAKK